MNDVILTIAVPTYNRANKLKICIDRLLEQVKSIKEVEVIVSDNASTDNTQEMMTDYCAEHDCIRYFRNDTNVGPDRNFLNCYEKANGKYVLLLGDDDFLLPGAVASIVSSLKKEPVALFINSCGIEDDKTLKYTRPRFEETGDISYNDKNQILKKVNIFITFMSSFVLRKDLICKIENKEQFINSYFIQSHIALATMKEDGLYILNTKNCLAASPNKTVGYDLYYVWFESYHKLFTKTAIESGFDKKITAKTYKKSIRKSVSMFIIDFRRTCENADEWE
ncbi:MAG: glycosyltransferase [Clostridia bacterium]|nr:glycosyltransferase [Clostridia bacterium]